MEKFLEKKHRSQSVDPKRDNINEKIKKGIERTFLNKDIVNIHTLNNKKEADSKNVNMDLMQALGQLDRPMYTGRLRSDCRLIKE